MAACAAFFVSTFVVLFDDGVLMLIKRPRFTELPGSEITPHSVFASRRLFMQQITAGALASSSLLTDAMSAESSTHTRLTAPLNPSYAPKDAPTKFEDASSYNKDRKSTRLNSSH